MSFRYETQIQLYWKNIVSISISTSTSTSTSLSRFNLRILSDLIHLITIEVAFHVTHYPEKRKLNFRFGL
ncbi:hypothetical protein VNO78_10043 [Psophocarpus tetragonolobus]|uniref:Uncharacterized protein n=1 Tax=Psophocarpus tetragonolobus TaxID=3891 RepID=A0AAN9SQA6_PSOTE